MGPSSGTRSMISLRESVTIRWPFLSGTAETVARSSGGFLTSSGTDCTKATPSSLRAFTGDETRGGLVREFARAPNPRLHRTRFALLRSPLSRKLLGRQRRASIAPAKADGGSPMSSSRRVP